MSKVIPMNIEAGDLPEHPLVDFGRAFVRRLDDGLHGIPEVKATAFVQRGRLLGEERDRLLGELARLNRPARLVGDGNPTPDELRDRWSKQGCPKPNTYENGIDYEPAVKSVETDGLVVTEFKNNG